MLQGLEVHPISIIRDEMSLIDQHHISMAQVQAGLFLIAALDLPTDDSLVVILPLERGSV